MIPKLNYYIERKHNIQICQINQYIRGKHIEDDKVHLTCEGYKLFVSKGLGPLLDYHWSVKNPKKEKPTELHLMMKAQRKCFFSHTRMCAQNAKHPRKGLHDGAT